MILKELNNKAEARRLDQMNNKVEKLYNGNTFLPSNGSKIVKPAQFKEHKTVIASENTRL